jgi:hypothetical protein
MVSAGEGGGRQRGPANLRRESCVGLPGRARPGLRVGAACPPRSEGWGGLVALPARARAVAGLESGKPRAYLGPKRERKKRVWAGGRASWLAALAPSSVPAALLLPTWQRATAERAAAHAQRDQHNTYSS